MTGVTTPDAPPKSPGPGTPDVDGEPGRSRGPSPWQIVGLVVAVCLLAGIIGWKIGDRAPSKPSASSVDVGFFYDMSAHHQQAISMALDYVRNGDDPRLLQMAKEIVTYQSSEIGMMNEYLAQWDHAGNRPAKAMGWMQPPVPYNEMPGLATQAQMDQLAAARGFELDTLFTQLMINHHAGGVHMAATAKKTAEEASTRRWAAAMDDGQRGEISEMNTWRTKHNLPTIVPPLAEFSG